MGVSLEIYRQRIGCYSFKGPNILSRYKRKSSKKSGSKVFFTPMFKLLLNFFIFVQAASNSSSNIQPCGSSSDGFQPSAVSCCALFLPFPLEASLSKLSSSSNNKSEKFIQPCGIAWSYSNAGNKLVHALNGNIRNKGYKYLSWNCAKGFLSGHKLEDVKTTINRHKPELIGISEIDLFRNENNLDMFATNNLSTQQLHEKLQIQGYKIFLPRSWETLGTARLIVYAKDDLKVKHLFPQDACYDHIQNISLEVGYGRAKTHKCNFYYREWTSCKNKRNDLQNQKEDLELLLDIWRNCTQDDKDFIALGDMNLCAKRWEDQSYPLKDLANCVKDFMSEENCSQVIENYTRIRSVNETVQRSCIDHATVNCAEKISSPLVLGVDKSDHLGIMITK